MLQSFLKVWSPVPDLITLESWPLWFLNYITVTLPRCLSFGFKSRRSLDADRWNAIKRWHSTNSSLSGWFDTPLRCLLPHPLHCLCFRLFCSDVSNSGKCRHISNLVKIGFCLATPFAKCYQTMGLSKRRSTSVTGWLNMFFQ